MASPSEEASLAEPTNLIVNYIPAFYNEGNVRALFIPCGTVRSCKLMMDKRTGKSLEYAFVDFETNAAAQEAVSRLNGMQLGAKRLKVSFARPRSKAITNANLYVRNLPTHLDDTVLAQVFSVYGPIVQARILRNGDGGSRGIGFVLFDQHEHAQQAIDSLNNTMLQGSTRPLMVKFANKGGDRDEQRLMSAMGLGVGSGGFAGLYGGSPATHTHASLPLGLPPHMLGLYPGAAALPMPAVGVHSHGPHGLHSHHLSNVNGMPHLGLQLDPTPLGGHHHHLPSTHHTGLPLAPHQAGRTASHAAIPGASGALPATPPHVHHHHQHSPGAVPLGMHAQRFFSGGGDRGPGGYAPQGGAMSGGAPSYVIGGSGASGSAAGSLRVGEPGRRAGASGVPASVSSGAAGGLKSATAGSANGQGGGGPGAGDAGAGAAVVASF